MFRRPTVVTAIACAVVLVVCGAALADNYSYKRIGTDDAAAASATIRNTDFPSQLNLSGGRVKPDESADADSCNGYSPKERDLVVTGDAESRLHDPSHAVVIDSQIQLFKSAAMAATDVQRGLKMVTAACQAQAAKQEHLNLVAYKVLGHPTCKCDFGLSFVLETKTSHANIDQLTIVTGIRKGRTEAAVITSVGKPTNDPQGGQAATQAAFGLQGIALKAVLLRLHAS